MCPNHTPEVPALKRCYTCQELKPVTTEFFGRDKTRQDGFRPVCKACRKKATAANRAKAAAYRAANKDRRLEYDRAYRAANRERLNERDCAYQQEYRERFRAYVTDRAAKYRAANKYRTTVYNRMWYLANKEYDAERKRKYYAANPDRAKARARRRRARKADAVGSHTAADIRAQYKRQKGKCYYCGVKVGDKYHVDHIVPLSRGGSDSPENLVVACPFCNVSKKDKLLHEWIWGGRLL